MEAAIITKATLATVAIAVGWWAGYHYYKMDTENNAKEEDKKYHEAKELKERERRDEANKKKNYGPQRGLPKNKDGVPKPETDAPHTELSTKKGEYDTYTKAREFDGKGKLIRDIEFTHHGDPKVHPSPHQHIYRDNPTGGSLIRGKPERLPEWKY